MQNQKKYTHQELEKYSSAFTLSDMEIFIFPELFYSLVLANIMSPVIWKWKEDKWFDGIEKKSFNYKVNRVKQYIMDKTVFNLDLDTWGLTDKETELNRFKDFVDTNALAQSNALFGYEGDKYYFKIDIRRHFGLDKYTDNVIPYWKTETVEAMTAFAYKNELGLAAGECVSFSSLYAAAMFVIGKIPLEKIFLIATPLHSQNFIMEKEGILTNNRRIVTKKMWYNGTELSAKARRAIENEKITIVSHLSGYIHTLYKEATISPEAYEEFSENLKSFLKAQLTFEIFINFLRTKPETWNCFQYRLLRNGKDCYIDLPTIYAYERSSKNTIANESKQALFEEMDARDFNFSHDPEKIILNDLEDYLIANSRESIDDIEEFFFARYKPEGCFKLSEFFGSLRHFLEIHPRLPSLDKDFITLPALQINPEQSREQIIEQIRSMRTQNPVADYAMYAYRKMDEIDWIPFVKAAIERNPVCLKDLKGKSTDEIYKQLQELIPESIYDEYRLALPDEVWNFKRGDGLEKIFILANVILNLNFRDRLTLDINNDTATLVFGSETYRFPSNKRLKKKISIVRKDEYFEYQVE